MIKKTVDTTTNIVTISIESSDYYIQYPKKEPWNISIYHHDDNVTAMIGNNLIVDLVLALDDMIEEGETSND